MNNYYIALDNHYYKIWIYGLLLISLCIIYYNYYKKKNSTDEILYKRVKIVSALIFLVLFYNIVYNVSGYFFLKNKLDNSYNNFNNKSNFFNSNNSINSNTFNRNNLNKTDDFI